MTEPSWRTVAVHGQPPHDDLVLIRTEDARYAIGQDRRLGKGLMASTCWIPITELETLPNAPTPPRTVTIEVSEDDARWLTTSMMITEIGRRMGDAARDALARLDAEDSA